MTAGDILMERGRKKGLEQGLAEGSATASKNILLKLLRGRFRAVPRAAIARIQAADQAQLDRWLDQILTAPTLEAALAEG